MMGAVDADSSDTVSLDEWVEAGHEQHPTTGAAGAEEPSAGRLGHSPPDRLCEPPRLRYNARDFPAGYFQTTMTQKDGQHLWRMKHFNKPVYCNVCHSMLLGLRKQGLCCTCKYATAPLEGGQCSICLCGRLQGEVANKQSMVAVLIGARLPAPGLASTCDKCQKKMKSYQGLSGKHCVWYHTMRHDESGSGADRVQLRDHILPGPYNPS
ncbi:Diacylglycerol kinase beta [Merluccius polli]|uniref:Diacylglycerol kinase beta n=1 Tax=Merluccius polli TaxID=89951 RepID=A0AA47MDT2_MERPO|nr:Diacylglycerol kinase beta [Merluccius polli]